MEIENLINQMENEKKIEIFKRTDLSIFCRSKLANKKCQIIKVPLKITPEMSFLAGIIVGDGHINERKGRSIQIEIEMAKLEILNLIKRFFNKVFGIKVKIFKIQGKDINRKRWRIVICNKIIGMIFNKVFEIPVGKKSKIVKVPKCALQNMALTKMFLTGLFLSDSGKKGKRIAFTTTSKKLFIGVKNLLHKFKISFSTRKWKHPKGTIVFDIIICKKNVITKFINTFPQLKIKFAGVR